MPFDVAHADDLAWEEREPMHGQAPRSQASVTDAAKLTQSRARMWRYPARTRGRRHLDPDQEEVFVPLRGTLTVLVEDPPQRVDVGPGEVVAIHPGTPMQLRNETDEDVVFFAYGAPPITGNAQFLDDVERLEDADAGYGAAGGTRADRRPRDRYFQIRTLSALVG